MSQDPAAAAAPIEVERVWLLRGMPALPATAEVWQLEQGYLAAPAGPHSGAAPGAITEGRLRRSVAPDGRETFLHTVKEGTGLVRREVERTLTREAFAAAWPGTAGRRLRKRRHRVPADGVVIEVDEFLGLGPVEGRPLVMAEVEFRGREEALAYAPPPWLSAEIVREVTEEPAFRNYSLAVRSGTIVPP